MEALSHVPQKTASENAVLEHALRRGVRTVFQPIISLETEAVLGYEALSRGPSGSELESPEELFRVAREAAGQVVELDRVCQAAAIRRALDASLPTHLALFVNAEPEAARHEVDEPHSDAFAEAGKRGLRLILEVTERALLNDPAGLLTGARRARSAGWGMALDDVGADTRALALLPVVEPDVIKLDMALIHNRPDSRTAEIVHAIAAEAERRGTSILAEGIETREQLEHARSLGATLGQGYLFGRPAPLAHEGADPGRRIPIGGAVHSGRPPTPFQVLSASRPTRTASKPLVAALARHLEDQAASISESALLISNFQHGGHLGPGVRARYAELARHLALVGALGTDVGPEPAPGVRGGRVSDTDPLQSEWSTALISPHFAGAIAALDLGDPGPDASRRFELAVTYDRNLVIECARSLLYRISPLPSEERETNGNGSG